MTAPLTRRAMFATAAAGGVALAVGAPTALGLSPSDLEYLGIPADGIVRVTSVTQVFPHAPNHIEIVPQVVSSRLAPYLTNPARFLDTRPPPERIGWPANYGPLGAGTFWDIGISTGFNVQGLVVNVIMVDNVAAGYLRVGQPGATSFTSTVNTDGPNQIVANQTMMFTPNQVLRVYASVQTDVAIDLIALLST